MFRKAGHTGAGWPVTCQGACDARHDWLRAEGGLAHRLPHAVTGQWHCSGRYRQLYGSSCHRGSNYLSQEPACRSLAQAARMTPLCSLSQGLQSAGHVCTTLVQGACQVLNPSLGLQPALTCRPCLYPHLGGQLEVQPRVASNSDLWVTSVPSVCRAPVRSAPTLSCAPFLCSWRRPQWRSWRPG